MVLCGLVFLIISSWLLYFNLFVLRKKGKLVEGEIVDFDKQVYGPSKYSYHPIIEYVDPYEGYRQNFTSNLGSPTKKRLGRNVQILVYKNKKGILKCAENTNFKLFIVPILVQILSISWIMFSLTFLFAN
jgi:hypothetical protein